MAKVYRIKSDCEVSKLEAIGYIFFPEQLIAAKIVKQPLNGRAAESLLERYYLNPRFKEEMYDYNLDYYKNEIGLTYKKDGTPKMTKKFKDFLSTWVIQIEFTEDFWIGFTSTDKYDATVFYNRDVLDHFCGVEIELLKEQDLIEEIEVNN